MSPQCLQPCDVTVISFQTAASVAISVRYPPLVKITKSRRTMADAQTEDTGLQVVKEGTPLNLICEAEGNPEQFGYKWSVDGHAVNGKM